MKSGIEKIVSKDLPPAAKVKYDNYVELLGRLVLANKKLDVRNLEHVLNNDPCMVVITHNAHIYDIIATAVAIPRTLFFPATDWLYSSKDARRLFKQFLERRLPQLGSNLTYYTALFTLLYPVSKFVSSRINLLEQIPVKVRYGKKDSYRNLGVVETAKGYLKAGRTVVWAPRDHRLKRESKYSNLIGQFKPGFAKILYELNEEGVRIPAVPLAMYGGGGFFGRRGKIVLNFGEPMYIDSVEDNPKLFAERIPGTLSDLERAIRKETVSGKQDIVDKFTIYVETKFAAFLKSTNFRAKKIFDDFMTDLKSEFSNFVEDDSYTDPIEIITDFSNYIRTQIEYFKKVYPELYKRVVVEGFRDFMEKTVAGLAEHARKLTKHAHY